MEPLICFVLRGAPEACRHTRPPPPPPSALAPQVVLRTSLGDIDLELWPKEAPKAVRNFVQLCLEGYYDGTVFHRVIKDFMAQGAEGARGGWTDRYLFRIQAA